MGIVSKNKNPYPQGIKVHGFQQLNKYKFDVIEQFMKNQELLKLLKYNVKGTNPLENPLDKPDVNLNNEIIIGDYILPYFKNESTVDETHCILKVYFGEIIKRDDVYKQIDLCIDVLIPEDEQLIEQGTRVEEIMHRVDEILNDSRGLGLGKLQFARVLPIENKVVSGYRMFYKILSLN